AVLTDRDARGALRDLDQLVGARRRGGDGRARHGAADHVETVSRHQVALVVAVEVAGLCVLLGARGERGGGARNRGLADTEPALALDRHVGGVPGGLESARAHHVVDRAELGAQADLRGIRAALAGTLARAAALKL